jgi:hypothetical protein
VLADVSCGQPTPNLQIQAKTLILGFFQKRLSKNLYFSRVMCKAWYLVFLTSELLPVSVLRIQRCRLFLKIRNKTLATAALAKQRHVDSARIETKTLSARILSLWSSLLYSPTLSITSPTLSIPVYLAPVVCLHRAPKTSVHGGPPFRQLSNDSHAVPHPALFVCFILLEYDDRSMFKKRAHALPWLVSANLWTM